MISLAEVALRWIYMSVGFALLLFFSFLWIDEPRFEKFTWIFFIFSSLLSIGLMVLLRLIKTKNKDLPTTAVVLLLITIRLLLSFAFLAIFIFFNKPVDKQFVLSFLIIYVAFKIFEVVNLSKYANHIDKRIEQKII